VINASLLSGVSAADLPDGGADLAGLAPRTTADEHLVVEQVRGAR
jgi:hypothetical protein